MTTSYPRESLSIDQQLALRTAATNLQRRFDGVFGAETIERFPLTWRSTTTRTAVGGRQPSLTRQRQPRPRSAVW